MIISRVMARQCGVSVAVATVCCAVLVIGGGRAVFAQTPRLCGVRISSEAVLGARDDTISAFEFPTIARDGRGRYFVAPDKSRGRVMVFDSSGGLRRLLGRVGDGPGEFRWAESVRASSDGGIEVVDPVAGRLVEYGSDLRLRRERRLPRGMHDAWRVSGDSIVGLGFVMSQRGIGLPLHVITADGSVARSYGNTRLATRFTPRTEVLAARHAVMGRDTTIWLAPFHEYRLERWSVRGERLTVMTISSPWFQSWETRPKDREDIARPVTEIAGLNLDRAGRVWIYASVPESAWRPDGRMMVRRGRETEVMDRGERDKYVDTVVEVVDSRTGSVQARARFDRALLPLRGDDERAFGWQVTPRGSLLPEIFRLSVTCDGAQ